ncbi:MAG: energy-coupling factor transporter transmembrane protein EcfT [Clostridia bacterium]|nr:energy-coupling factor transporter transmembrane protein EcfT [Clostridia bacterium]MBO5299182.1 energy-coupling factor transporter transmembrane protein EcfT [Clostridia bacterium]
MIKDITLGQFFPGNSVIHKLDPRVKIILAALYIAFLFVVQTAVGYAFAIAATLVFVSLTKIPLKMYLRGLKPLLFILIFTALLNVFYSTGEPLVEFWIFKITADGIKNAIFMILRIFMLVIATSMLTYTTSPIVLTNGLERLLSPLSKIKVPVHEFSMMMTIALRFIPTLLEETDKIMNAQKARGADFETGGLIKRAKALAPILIPLFISAFRRADELATAMECRCYTGSSEGRTHLVSYSMSGRDVIALIVVICMIAIAVLLNYVRFFGF